MFFPGSRRLLIPKADSGTVEFRLRLIDLPGTNPHNRYRFVKRRLTPLDQLLWPPEMILSGALVVLFIFEFSPE
jgi:hypothetical protein